VWALTSRNRYRAGGRGTARAAAGKATQPAMIDNSWRLFMR
jgi:hypothetical protein